MRERDQTSSFDEAPVEDRFPIRHVGLFCDRGCGAEVEADIRADSAEQAYEGLRRHAVSDLGWFVSEIEDLCGVCLAAVEP